MCVCVHGVHVFRHMCVRMNICSYIYCVSVYTHVHVCVGMFVFVCVHVWSRVCSCCALRICVCTDVCVCVCAGM